MTKEEYLAALKKRLSGLSEEDINERISFYEEIIDDRIEDGVSEEEAVASIGTVDSVVDQILSEIPVRKFVKNKVTEKRKSGAGTVVLWILLFPIWFPLLITVFAILFSLYIVIWVLVLCLYIVDLSFALSAVVCFIAIFVYLYCGNPPGALFALGAGIFMTGLAILLFPACNAFAKGVCVLTKKVLLSIKNRFVGKESAV